MIRKRLKNSKILENYKTAKFFFLAVLIVIPLLLFEGDDTQSLASASVLDNPIQITFLGTGAPNIDPSLPRFQTSIVVDIDGDRWLVDCGIGAVAQLYTLNIAPMSIDYFFVTHHHVDHFADAGAFVFTRWHNTWWSSEPRLNGRDVKQNLHVFGPAGTDIYIKNFFKEFLEKDSRSRWIAADPSLEFTEVERGEFFATQSYRISTVPVIHRNMPTRAFRIDRGSISLVISGDVGPGSWEINKPLAELSKNADMMIIDAVHMNPENVGLLAKEAAVKKLILTHMTPTRGALSGELYRAKSIADGVKKVFRGEVLVAEDGMKLQL